MPRLVVAHDYVCPWCFAGWRQGLRLREEFPTLELEWRGFELLPAGMEYTPTPPDPDEAKKPRIPTRLELLLAADGLTLPERKGPISNSRRALEGAEFAAEVDKADAWHDAVYHAYWNEDRDISDLAVLTEIGEQVGLNIAGLLSALEEGTFRDRVIEFNEPAHAAGIWHVPTWEFPEAWIAEQPYSVVRTFASRFIAEQAPFLTAASAG